MHAGLTAERLLIAYASGMFPMADSGGEIGWYCPDPRAIIELEGFHVGRSLRQVVRQQRLKVLVNRAFRRVIEACAERGEGTWISPEIIEAYSNLHELGYAHSVEAWRGEALAGGLYGVALGGAFFGESMFHLARDASKVALVALVERLRERGYVLLDTQFMTPHLARFGAVEIPRREYFVRLRKALRRVCRFEDDERPEGT